MFLLQSIHAFGSSSSRLTAPSRAPAIYPLPNYVRAEGNLLCCARRTFTTIGSYIGVSPVSRNDGWISANGCAAKFALQAFAHLVLHPNREHRRDASCYLGLRVMPPVGCRLVSRRVQYDRAQLIPEGISRRNVRLVLKGG